MPGNEVGGRVHDFFAQDNLSQGQHQSEVVDGSWPGGSNLWAGSQTHIDLPSSNSKNYNLHQSDIEGGHSNHSLPVSHGFNLTQPTVRPELAKSKPQNQQPNLNGYNHGHHILQTRQNGSNFLGMDSESRHRNLTSRGLSIHESQQGNDHENHSTLVRSESCESPVSFDFFGSQQQMSGRQTGMMQPLPRQQSGFSDMQLLQQQMMMRKMQELQRQQQIQQLQAMRQNSLNQIPSTPEQASGGHSPTLINGTPISPINEASNFPWATEPTAGNTSWLQRATPAIQGYSDGFRFSPEQGQAMSLMGLVPQQVDQSLYGVPVSSTRGTPHQYSHVPPDRPPMRQVTMNCNSSSGNQFTGFSEQFNIQDGSLVSRQRFQGGNLFSQASGQGLDSGMNLENFPQVNSMQRTGPWQEIHERLELTGPSETLQEKTTTQVSSSQNVATLDPTEEKILFGDDNIWDAFGSSANMGAGGFNMLNGSGFSNGITSLQSGSWSALMQSAVAETTSNDHGLQEGWSGLSCQNTEVAAGNRHPSAYVDGMKQQAVAADNNLHTASAWSIGSAPLPNDANVNYSYQGIPGFQQSGQKISYGHGERQADSTHSTQQSSEELSKWLSRGPLQKPLAEGNQNRGNDAQSLDAEMNVKSISGSWTNQLKVPSLDYGQQQNEPNGRNVVKTANVSQDALSRNPGNEDKLQRLHSGDAKRMMHEEMSHGGHMWEGVSGQGSTLGLEHAKFSAGRPQVSREDVSSNNLAKIPHSSAARAGQETSQLVPNSDHLNYWKHADSSLKSKGSTDLGKFQHHLNKGPQVLESSMNNSDKDAVEMHETENCDRKENYSGSPSSNLSQHTTTGGIRENIWSEGSDSLNLPGGKQKFSVQAGRRTPGHRKFQYHPLGNLDEDIEPSYGMEHATHSQVMSQQIPRASYSRNQGYFGQSKFSGQFPNTSNDMEKDLQGNKKEVEDAPSKGTLPGFAPNTSATFDRSVARYEPNKAAQSRQNMLELLHKVDESQERGNYDGYVGPQQQNQSSASQGFSLQLAPPSQRLPIQNPALASPSSALTDGSHSRFHPTPEMREKGRTWLTSTAQVQSFPFPLETSQGEFKFSRIGMPGQTGNEASQYVMQPNFSPALSSGFPHSQSQLQNQQMIGAREVTTDQPMSISFDRHASHSQQTDDHTGMALTGRQSMPASLPDTAGFIPQEIPVSSGDTSLTTDPNCSRGRISAPQISVVQAVPSSQPFISSGISQEGAISKLVPNTWTSVPGQHHLFGAQPQKFPPKFFQPSLSNNNVLPTSSSPQDQEDRDVRKGGNGPSELGVNSVDLQGFVLKGQPAKQNLRQLVSSGYTDLAEKMTESEGKESVFKNLSDASPSNSASTQRDIEAFGRSLKQNDLLQENYSLLQQMQAMKSTEVDPSNRSLKRLKRADSGLGCQIAPNAGQGEHNVMVEDLLVHRGAVSGDAKMLSLLGPADNWDRKASSQLGNVPSQDVLPFGQKDSEKYSHSSSAASVRAEHSQISPQMAPSWFNQFGNFKNGQMLPMYDARKNGTVKTLEQPFTLGKSSDGMLSCKSLELENAAVDSNQVGHIWQRSTPSSVGIEHFSSSRPLAQDATDQSLVVVRPKKRKSATSELLPWHKEGTQSSKSLLNISLTEVDWAKAANRLIDKVEVEADIVEDAQPVVRTKNRLILTTQLMQQLFRAPPAAVLSADASLTYETVAYLAARLALGDACSLIPFSGSNSCVPLDSSNLLSDKQKTSERMGDQHLSKVVEDFIDRARKVESEFMRLEKRTVLDLRIENQELEKYSVINRFARFHGRGQADADEVSSSSDAAAYAQRPFPQRYVTAVPMPRNLPDRVQCLSL